MSSGSSGIHIGDIRAHAGRKYEVVGHDACSTSRFVRWEIRWLDDHTVTDYADSTLQGDPLVLSPDRQRSFVVKCRTCRSWYRLDNVEMCHTFGCAKLYEVVALAPQTKDGDCVMFAQKPVSLTRRVLHGLGVR